MENERPKYFTSIFSTVISLAVFLLAYMIAGVLLTFLVNFILDVPVFGYLLSRIILFRGDSAASLVATFAALIAAVATLILIFKINTHEPTSRLTCTMTGVLIMVIHALSAIINLLTGAGVWVNIMQFIAGYIIFSGRK